MCVSTYINPYYNPAAGDRGVNIFKRTKYSGGCSVTTHACSWFTCCHASEGGYDIRLQVSLDWGALSHTLFLQAPSKQTKGEEFTETETAREMEDNQSLEDSPTPLPPQQHAKRVLQCVTLGTCTDVANTSMTKNTHSYCKF